MVRYIIKRLFIGVVTIWALITITFFLIRIMPGSPFEADNLSRSAIEQLESTYGLDEPMWKQYILYMENLMHGDLGISYKKNVSVNTLIARGFPYTLSIGLRVTEKEEIDGLDMHEHGCSAYANFHFHNDK